MGEQLSEIVEDFGKSGMVNIHFDQERELEQRAAIIRGNRPLHWLQQG